MNQLPALLFTLALISFASPLPAQETVHSSYMPVVPTETSATTLAWMMAGADGQIKTSPLRGLKDSPPYLHDGRLLTIEDTVEFFNPVLETKLTSGEKADLVAFLRVL